MNGAWFWSFCPLFNTWESWICLGPANVGVGFCPLFESSESWIGLDSANDGVGFPWLCPLFVGPFESWNGLEDSTNVGKGLFWLGPLFDPCESWSWAGGLDSINSDKGIPPRVCPLLDPSDSEENPNLDGWDSISTVSMTATSGSVKIINSSAK